MTITPTKNQQHDSDRMANGSDLPNFSMPGTGKTITTLLAHQKAGFDRGLVVGPVISIYMWEEVIQDFLGKEVQVLDKPVGVSKDADFVVTTFGRARSMQGYLMKAFDGGSCIVDESQNVRNHTAKQTQALVGPECDGDRGLFERFDQYWQLSGTPQLKHADDYWAQLRAIAPQVLKEWGVLDYEDWCKSFTVRKKVQYHTRMSPKVSVVGSTNERLLNRMLYEDIGIIRREEPEGLPPMTSRKVHIKADPSPELGELMKGVDIADLMRWLTGKTPDDEKKNKAQAIWRAVYMSMVKEGAAYVDELTYTTPVLLGVWHNDVGDAYQKEFEARGMQSKRVYGATPQKERDRIKDSFNAGDIDVIVGQMGAMGVSWNLQTLSNHVVVAQDYYSAGVVEQFYKRVWRWGQKSHVQLDFLTSGHALCGAIASSRMAKEQSAAAILKQPLT